MHPVEALWAEHAPVAGYPRGVVSIPEPIPGLAFFPGGSGLWHAALGQPLPPFPLGGVMVLGHDFHSEEGYRASLARGHERYSQPTWRNLTVLLGEAGVDLGACFFTNVYMGLRAGAKTTGPFPGATDPAFVAHCRRFLVRQLAAQRPALILTLGVYAPRMLAPISPDLAHWADGRGFRHLDEVGPVRVAAFPDVPGLTAAVVALTHPCMRTASVHRRRYGAVTGGAAELSMLHDGLAAGAPGV